MAEWSKAVDLRSTIFGCAGSNPAGSIIKNSYSNKQHKFYLTFNQTYVLKYDLNCFTSRILKNTLSLLSSVGRAYPS